MLANKRPVAFKNINYDLDTLENFQQITPENIIRGCDLPMLNFVIKIRTVYQILILYKLQNLNWKKLD